MSGAERRPAGTPWEGEVEGLLADRGRSDLATGFIPRAPASYRDQTTPAEAALDAIEVEQLASASDVTAEPHSPADRVFGGAHRLVVRASADPECTFRIRRFGEHSVELTRLLPVLESFGLVVVESVPHRLLAGFGGEPALHVDDIGVRVDPPHGEEALRFVPEIHGPRLVSALEAAVRGDTDVDSLNRLVTLAGLDWRQVTLLRVYLRYWMQAGAGLAPAALTDPLVEYADFARSLVGYFQARFDPSMERDESGASAAEATERARCLAVVDLVPHLEQDTVLRGFLALVDATLRTNYFITDGSGAHRPAIVVKFDSSGVPTLPNPRPKFEAFVHGPEVEGIHLRAGMIARGGLRASDRPDDFRTEVLDLALAQVKKNAIIVPTGAKGGFVSRIREADRLLAPQGAPGSRQSGAERIRIAYENFVASLLDITDNVVAGATVTPFGVVARDAADPYLVVAADKGTATFSDLANSISARIGFWLGDAFASGGSRGYDHKRLGITARGAWVAVTRHFRQLGIDVQREPITVVGVGDMSGDVFGNGMLQSEQIRLVAAFDHRHVFLDPEPDPVVAFAERRRLVLLGHSSWADYALAAISAGGGVWPRDAKSIPLAPAARRALGVESEELSPPEVISAILSAPVDLLWFGGIGTFVKAPGESDVDVGDHANDQLRITSDRLRVRVVAEGGNLGITQQGRIRYSRRGGRINADFIDNAAGVATSDREVNLKILLALAIEEGRLDPSERDEYLQRSTDEVAREVLRQVDHSVTALERAVAQSAGEPDAFASLIDSLEKSGLLDRTVESLPDAEELRVRRDAGAGLIRPELAVLLAYAKSDLVSEIEQLMVSEGDEFLDAVIPYFPAAVRNDFGDLIPKHRLYPQLAATDVAGEVIDQMGIVWGHEISAELGRPLADVARAFWAARGVLDAGGLWSDLEGLARSMPADAEAALHAEITGAVVYLARSYLLRPTVLRVSDTVESDGPIAKEISLLGLDEGAESALDRMVDLGAARDVAMRCVVGSRMASVADVGPVVSLTGRSVGEVSEMLSGIDRVSGIDAIKSAVASSSNAVPAPGRLTLWLGRSVLDDVAAWRRAVAAKVLADGVSPAEGLTTWETEHREALASATRMFGTTSRERSDLLDTAVLVVRRLQRAV